MNFSYPLFATGALLQSASSLPSYGALKPTVAPSLAAGTECVIYIHDNVDNVELHDDLI
jgi:hypothetical protein